MARKNYSAEFRRDAVELYRVTEGATIAGIAADLGISYVTLSTWVKAAGVPVRGARGPAPAPPPDDGNDGPDGPDGPEEVARLRARVAELEAKERTLETERDILRAAAKYFAGETNW